MGCVCRVRMGQKLMTWQMFRWMHVRELYHISELLVIFGVSRNRDLFLLLWPGSLLQAAPFSTFFEVFGCIECITCVP